MKPTLKSISILLLALATAALIYGCSSDANSNGGSSDAPTVADEEKAAQRVVTDLFNAYLEGEGEDACKLQTDSYTEFQLKEAASEESFKIEASNCEELVEMTSPIMRQFFESETLKIKGVTVKGDTAEVKTTIATSFGPSNTVYSLVKVNDAWLVDGEVDLDAEPEVTAATIRQWAGDWCSVRVGMTREEVESIMGKPSSEFDGSGGEAPQVSYEGFGYSFGVFFDIEGEVKQLDFAPGDDKIGIDCESTRK